MGELRGSRRNLGWYWLLWFAHSLIVKIYLIRYYDFIFLQKNDMIWSSYYTSCTTSDSSGPSFSLLDLCLIRLSHCFRYYWICKLVGDILCDPLTASCAPHHWCCHFRAVKKKSMTFLQRFWIKGGLKSFKRAEGTDQRAFLFMHSCSQVILKSCESLTAIICLFWLPPLPLNPNSWLLLLLNSLISLIHKWLHFDLESGTWIVCVFCLFFCLTAIQADTINQLSQFASIFL